MNKRKAPCAGAAFTAPSYRVLIADASAVAHQVHIRRVKEHDENALTHPAV